MARRGGTGEWANWAGDQRCRPARILRPRSRKELAEAVAAAAAGGQKVRVAGSGHSFTEAALTAGTMIPGRGDHGRLRRPPPRGQAPLPDRGDAGAALPRMAGVPAARDELDPDRVFANEYTDRVQGL